MENHAAHAHLGHVLLDIGGDVGALIVFCDGDMHGVEVEISPTGHDERRSHKDVLERSAGDRPAHTAVFDHLHEGTYTLWVDGVARARDVAVTGGAIAGLDWTSAAMDVAAVAQAPVSATSRLAVASRSARAWAPRRTNVHD